MTNELALARGLIAQIDFNFALIGVLIKIVDASPTPLLSDEMMSSIREAMEQNSKIVQIAALLVEPPENQEQEDER